MRSQVIMKIRLHILISIIISLLLPSATSFLHHYQPSLTRVKHNHATKRKMSLSASEPHNSIISQLAFYPTDESFSERLKNVLSEWDQVKKDGIGKFFSDELNAAEKIVKGNVASAETNANKVMLDGQKGGGGDYLLKDGFHNMADTGIKLANEIRAVQQVFNELNAAKIVEEAAEDVVSTGLLMEKDLAMVVQNVVSSLKEAEEVIQLAITAVASKEGLSETAKDELMETLEAKARNIEESIKVANSVAKTAKQIAGEDQKVMSELGKTGDRLSDAMDATTTSLTENLNGVEGAEAIDAVSKIVSQAAAIVREDLSAAENIADAVGQKVVVEADAVISIMEDKASDSVEAVRAAKTMVQESTSSDTSEVLQAALTKNAEEVRADQDTAERLAEAIQQDALNDQEAFEVLESSSREVNSLIEAVDGAVGKAAETVSANDSEDGGVITDAVEKVEEKMEEVEESMSNVMDAVEQCQDCKVKEMMEELEEGKISETAKGEVEIESIQAKDDTAHNEDNVHDEKEFHHEKDDKVSETHSDDEVHSADVNVHDVEVSSSGAEEAKPTEHEFNGEKEESVDHKAKSASEHGDEIKAEKEETLTHNEHQHSGEEGEHEDLHHEQLTSASGHADEVKAGNDETLAHGEHQHSADEGMHEESHHELIASTSGHADDVGALHDELKAEKEETLAHSEIQHYGDMGVHEKSHHELIASASGHADGDGLGDIVESGAALVDSLTRVESTHSLEHAVANAARIVADGDLTAYSETAHEISTWSTDSVAGAIAVVSSLFMG